MSDKELLFTAMLLLQSSDVFSRRICEDIDPRADTLFSEEEKEELTKVFDAMNQSINDPLKWTFQASVHVCILAWRIINYLAIKHGIQPMIVSSQDNLVIDQLIVILTEQKDTSCQTPSQ